PVAQMGLAREQMRLFKVKTMGASTFLRAIVSKDLHEAAEVAPEAVEAYRAARASRRKPYCEHCRRHYGSVDFSVCPDRSSIRCTGGTCGGGWYSRGWKAAGKIGRPVRVGS